MEDDWYEICVQSLNYGDRFQFGGIEYIVIKDYGKYVYAITAESVNQANSENYDENMEKFHKKLRATTFNGVVAVCELAEYLKDLYPYEFSNLMNMLCRQKLSPWWLGKENNYMAYVSDGHIRIVNESDKIERGLRPLVLFDPETEVLYEYNM